MIALCQICQRDEAGELVAAIDDRKSAQLMLGHEGCHFGSCRPGTPGGNGQERGPFFSAPYDRCVGICYLDGEDISEILVRRGLARDCPRFSRGRYAEAERRAVSNGATISEVYSLPGYCRPR